MSEHRILCPAEPPELTQPNGPIAGALGNHRHACKHDVFRPDSPDIGGFIEHECECGMRWVLTTATEQP